MTLSNKSVSTLIGIALTVLGAGIMAGGSVYTKKGIEEQALASGALSMYPVQNKTWVLAQIAYVTGVIIHFAALAFAPASVLAPTNSVGLVINALMSAVVLDEAVTVPSLISIVGILIGLGMCGAVGFLDASTHEAAASGLDSWNEPEFLSFLVAAVFSLAVGVTAVVTFETMWEKRYWSSQFSTHIRTGHAERRLLSKEFPEEETVCCGAIAGGRFPMWLGIAYGIMAGVVGSFVVLELKEFLAAASLPRAWTAYQLYLSCFLLCLATAASNHLLSLGLSRGKAMVVVPTYYVFWTVAGTLGGVTKFHEGEHLSGLQAGLLAGGILCTLISVVPLAVTDLARLGQKMSYAKQVDNELPGSRHLPVAIGLPLSFAVVSLNDVAAGEDSLCGGYLNHLIQTHPCSPGRIR